jgi:BirA family biotin operon repressor/biotin-[acetyl-CoA-carboxylase] ligase
MLSILFRPEPGQEPEPRRYTMLVSVALAQAIEQLLPRVAVQVKWPNDLMIGTRKVCGVLAEGISTDDGLAVVVGAGTNVSALDPQAPATATSLAAESGRTLDRGDLLLELLSRMDDWAGGPHGDLHRAWESRLWALQQVVRLHRTDSTGTRDQQVRVLGVTADGLLRVEHADGRVEETAAAEVIL